MQSEQAETLALKGLAYIASDFGTLRPFLESTGLTPADLRKGAGEPELLAAVLDFLLSDDARLTAFCDAEDLTPPEVHAARRALPGADEG